jgi:anaerobic selenocysteine-containing dehydrogenase
VFGGMTDGAETTRRSACNLCEAICGIEVTVDADAVTGVRGDPGDPLSRGYICPKALALIDIHQDPRRLRVPVRRVRGPDGADSWTEIGWDEAIDLVARELARVRKAHGRDAVAAYYGNPVVHSLGAMTHGTVFGSLLRTRNRFSATSCDQLPHQVVSFLLYGHQLLLPEPDLDRTRHLLIFGANPLASNGSMMTAPGMNRRLRDIRARGGRVVVVDPRRTETAAVVDEHVFIHPGADAALLLAMVNVALALRRPELPEYVADLEHVRSAIAAFSPEAVARFTGVGAATIQRLAREFVAADGAACYGRIGVSTQRFGTLCHWAIQLLNIVTGNLDREGGTLLPDPAVDLVAVTSPGDLGRHRSRVRGLPSFSGEFPVAALAEEITTPGEGRVRALLTVSGNPVVSTPGGPRLAAALGRLEFMAAVDFYVNETTRHADVILPPTSALERDHYDLVFRAFAVRNTAKYTAAAVAKPPGARHDWEIFRDLGLRYQRALAGSAAAYAGSRLQARNAATEARLRLSPRQQVDLLLRTGPYKLSVRKLLAHPSGIDLGPLRPGIKRRLRTPDRRIHLLPAEIAADLPALRDALLVEGTGDPSHPLRLIGRRHMRGNNSWMNSYPRLAKGGPRDRLLMHPADVARYRVGGGDALLSSAAGSVRVEIVATEDVMEGTVSLPHGFAHPSVNDVTDPARLDHVCGNAAFNGLPVAVTAA